MKLEKNDFWILFGIAALCLIVRLVYFTGIYINDDVQYIDHAVALAQGINIWAHGGSQLAFRTGMVVPLAILYKLFGYHEYTFAAYPIICSLSACVCIFIGAYRFWGRWAAILSSSLWVLFPLQICYDTSLSTAPQMAFFAAGAFLCFMEGQRLQNDKVNATPPWKFRLIYFCCGLLIGMGWLTSALFCLIVFIALAIIVFLKPTMRTVGLILAGFLTVLCLEFAYCSIYSGDPLARIRTTQATESVISSERRPDYLPRVLFDIVNVDYFDHEGHCGIQWYIFILFTACAFIARERICMGIATGVWLVLAYLQWGIMSPDLTPISKHIRYLSLTIPFVCLVSGWAFSRAFVHHIRFLPIVSKILFLVYCVHFMVITGGVIYKNRAVVDDFRETYRIIVSRRLPEPIYTDFRTRHYLELYSYNKLQVLDVETFVKNRNLPEQGILIKYCSDISRNKEYCEQSTPWWYRTPPSHWIFFDEIMTMRTWDMEFDPRIYLIRKSNLSSGTHN
jgi:hypothetical protein